MVGSTLGHYSITAKLGEGGMGEVFRATDTKLRREVAIKAMPASKTDAPQLVLVTNPLGDLGGAR